MHITITQLHIEGSTAMPKFLAKNIIPMLPVVSVVFISVTPTSDFDLHYNLVFSKIVPVRLVYCTFSVSPPLKYKLFSVSGEVLLPWIPVPTAVKFERFVGKLKNSAVQNFGLFFTLFWFTSHCFLFQWNFQDLGSVFRVFLFFVIKKNRSYL